MADSTRADRERAFQNALLFGGSPGAQSPETFLETATKAAAAAKEAQRDELAAKHNAALTDTDAGSVEPGPMGAGAALAAANAKGVPSLPAAEGKAVLGQALEPQDLNRLLETGSAAMSPQALAQFVAKQAAGATPAPPVASPPVAAPTPAPAPSPAMKAKGAVAAPLVMEPMEIAAKAPLAPVEGVGGAGPGPEAPAPAASAPPTSDEDSELKAAQAAVAANRGDWKNHLFNVLSAFTSGGDQLRQERQAKLNQPLTDLIQKRTLLDQAQKSKAEKAKAQRETDLSDPTSATTKRNAAMLYAAYGIKAPPGFSADQTADYVAASKLKGDERDKALDNLRADAAQKESARHNREQEGVEWGRVRAEQAAKALAAGKSLQEQDAGKLAAQKDAPEIIQELRNKQANVGLSGVLGAITPEGLHFGAQREYDQARNAAAGPLSVAAYPLARSESPELTNMVKGLLPGGVVSKETAGKQLDVLENNIRRASETKLNALSQGGVRPQEINALRIPAKAATAAPGGAAPATAHPQAAQALAWARLHPTDPDAQTIMARLGGG